MPKFLVRIVALLIFVAGPKPATAYDVCTDDIEAPADTSCVHEYMAETGFSVFSPGGIRNSELPLGSAAIIAALRNGAGHEDQTDHIYAYDNIIDGLPIDFVVTVTHFWNPDPAGGLFLDLYNQTELDGNGSVLGEIPNNWQKSQALWSRALAERAAGNFSVDTGAYHYLGHVVHFMGDNTIPTHAHNTAHDPGNRDAFENWMSNKLHDAKDNRIEYPAYHHVLSIDEFNQLTASTSDYESRLGRIDPMLYADLDFDIPEVPGLESPDQKLLWLQYTTNQIADFFADDQRDGDFLDPSDANLIDGWAQGDLNKMLAAIDAPKLAANLILNDLCDCDQPPYLSTIREYSYLRGIRAIGGLYRMFEQTVAQKPILTIEVNSATVALPNGTCNDGEVRDTCDFYSRVSFTSVYPEPGISPALIAISGQNEGDEILDADEIIPFHWRWGHAVENSGFAVVNLQLVDEDSTTPDSPVRIIPDAGDDSDGGKFLRLEVDLAKCMRGQPGALRTRGLIFDPSTLSQISSTNCGQPVQTRVTGNESENEGIAQLRFTVRVVEFAPPIVTCAEGDDTWHPSNIGVPCTAVDEGSGFGLSSTASFNLSTQVAEGVETSSAETTSQDICDVSGNCSTAGPVAGYKIDRKSPSISVPADVTVEATAGLTTVDIGVASATDAGSGLGSLGSNAESSEFPVGTTVVTWTATDNVGNMATAEQMVTVADTVFPIITPPPNVTVIARKAGEYIGKAKASDAIGIKEIWNDAPDLFPQGGTTVTWYAMDEARNVSSATQIVTGKVSGGGAFGFNELLLLLLCGAFIRGRTTRLENG